MGLVHRRVWISLNRRLDVVLACEGLAREDTNPARASHRVSQILPNPVPSSWSSKFGAQARIEARQQSCGLELSFAPEGRWRSKAVTELLRQFGGEFRLFRCALTDPLAPGGSSQPPGGEGLCRPPVHWHCTQRSGAHMGLIRDQARRKGRRPRRSWWYA